ncbi:piggyBac transposable element-derived protein 4-like [Lingula anatina]|uniref:PiggyBac transposable element-derived protein 4-like n=1 Tax=Lingula anatina TaxID=7574 RepID=A0A1S3I0B6_LINAN|nr:piggyBac transposable element-derived protein 4-like [Lingula anatina]|eukprot:XP_013391703.1 piggyBac transposable element-derived protein 4-like [Lingula anatina]
MGGIDRADKAMTYYMVLHRCVKWWKKVFFYLLEVCFCNSLIIYKQQMHPKRVNAEKFRLDIAHGLLVGLESAPSRVGRPPRDPPCRLINCEHFIAINRQRTANGKPSKPDCIVCSNREKKCHQTQYICDKCLEPMCPYPCFKRYHTLLD